MKGYRVTGYGDLFVCDVFDRVWMRFKVQGSKYKVQVSNSPLVASPARTRCQTVEKHLKTTSQAVPKPNQALLLGYCLGTAWEVLGKCLGTAWHLLERAWLLLETACKGLGYCLKLLAKAPGPTPTFFRRISAIHLCYTSSDSLPLLTYPLYANYIS